MELFFLVCSSIFYSSFIVHYSNVANSGIENSIAYLSANIELFTIKFNLVDMFPIPLCYETMVGSDENLYDCPGDGTYDYSINYTLPSAGAKHQSWLASGWRGTGLIQLYAEMDDTMLMGECDLNLQTYVTRPERKFSLIQVPSAAVATGLFLCFIVLVAMFCCYRCLSRSVRSITNKNTSKLPDEVSYFQKMEDQKSVKSQRSTRSTRTKSSTNNTKDNKSDSNTVVSQLI